MSVKLGFLLALTFLASVGNAVAQTLPSHVTSPCSDNEHWDFSAKIPKAWQDQYPATFNAGNAGEKETVKKLLGARTLFEKSQGAEAKAFAQYWMGRALWQLKLVHLATDAFRDVVALPLSAETTGIRLAALGCLLNARKKYENVVAPILDLQGRFMFDLKRLAPADRLPIWETILQWSIHGASRDGLVRLLTGPMPAYPEQRPFYLVARMLESARGGNDGAVIEAGTALFKTDNLPDAIQRRTDRLHLILGESYYNLGRYDLADREFGAVKNTANVFVDALIGQAWSKLQKNDYSGAAGAAQGLLTGALRRVFAPDAYLVLSIALNETCHYREAVDYIKIFKQRYQRTQTWLAQWSAIQERRSIDMYRLATGYLKREFNIPDPVGLLWLGSPVFIAVQSELNLLIDEKHQIARLSPMLRGFRSPPPLQAQRNPAVKDWYDAGRSIYQLLEKATPAFSAREHELVLRIQDDLIQRTKTMLPALESVNLTNDLISAEAYNGFGETVIASQILSEHKKAESKPEKAKTASTSGPVWDWGKLTTDDNQAREVWEDEVGFLKTDVTNVCTH